MKNYREKSAKDVLVKDNSHMDYPIPKGYNGSSGKKMNYSYDGHMDSKLGRDKVSMKPMKGHNPYLVKKGTVRVKKNHSYKY